MADGYKYDNKPRGVFRFLLALWRLVKDPENINEAAIVELTFNRSRWGKKIARWDLLAEETARQDASVATAMASRVRLQRVELDALLALPAGSFGHEFAKAQRKRGVDPNLVEPLPSETDGEWLIAHLYETHDFWHFASGFAFDIEGEYGVAGIYMAQMPRNSFIAFMLGILLWQTVWQDRDQLGAHIAAFCHGYEMGKKANPLVGLDWPGLWQLPLAQLRNELDIGLPASDDPLPEVPQEFAQQVA